MYRRIVVGADGSPAADRAVAAAGELARLARAEVQLVTAYRPVRAAVLAGSGGPGGPPDPGWSGDNERFLAEEVVRAASDRLERLGVDVHSMTRLGEPADALLAVAEELNADLLVIGSGDPPGRHCAPFGSLAERIARHAPCDVYVVRVG